MFLQFHVTRDCNLRCKHCYDPGARFTDGDELSTSECSAVIKEFASFLLLNGRPGVVYITGGEPLLRGDIDELLDTCRKFGMATRLLTNGTLIDDDVAEKLKASQVTAVQVSLDGLKGTHDEIRGTGSYDKAVAGIRALVDKGIPVTVMTTAGRHNAKEIPALWSECVKMGVRRLAFGRLVPTGRGEKLSDMVLTPNECLELFNSVRAFESKNNGGTEIVKRDPLWRMFDGRRHDDCTLSGCSIGLNGLCILQNGDVLPCRRLPIVLGNIRRESMYSIWTRSGLLEDLRERRLEGACGSCALRTRCGGCRGIAHATTGNLHAADPQCFVKLLNR